MEESHDSSQTEESQPQTKSVRVGRKQVAPWSKEATRQFIELIEAHECLWNVENSAFKHKYTRAAAWETVSLTMGREEMDCYAKWNSLRTNYRAKVIGLKKTKSGQEAIVNNQLIEPYSWMKFLMPFITTSVPKVRESNLSATFTDDSNLSDCMYSQPTGSLQPFQTNTPKPSVGQRRSKRPRLILATPPTPNKSAARLRKIAARVLHKYDERSSTDEYTAFTDNIAIHMRRLPIHQALELEIILSKAMYQYIGTHSSDKNK